MPRRNYVKGESNVKHHPRPDTTYMKGTLRGVGRIPLLSFGGHAESACEINVIGAEPRPIPEYRLGYSHVHFYVSVNFFRD